MEATICVRMAQKGKENLDAGLVFLAISYIVQGFRRTKIINMLKEYHRSQPAKDRRSPLARPPPPSKSAEVEKYLRDMEHYNSQFPPSTSSHHKKGKSSSSSKKSRSRSRN